MSENEKSPEDAHDQFNMAGEFSIVGIQGDHVHDNNVYITHQGDSPQAKYEVGVRYLRGGVPARASASIDDAMVRGHDGPEVRFHWALAMFAKRSWADLRHDEQERVLDLATLVPNWPAGEWRSAVEAVVAVAQSLRRSRIVSEDALDTLDAVPDLQRVLIVQHLDFVLTGAAKDRSWARTCQTAQAGQQAHGRRGRVWAYFYPEPIGPRDRRVVSPVLDRTAWFRLVVWYIVLVFGLGGLGQVILSGPSPGSAFALVPMLAAAVVALLTGHDIHYRRLQLAAKEKVHFTRRARAPGQGFAQDVDDSFERYLRRYLPDEGERRRFEAETRGPRAALRNEIVEDYREQRTTIKQVSWLIRYVLRELIDQWQRGQLYDYRARYRTPVPTVGVCVSAVLVVVVSGSFLAAAAMATGPVLAGLFTLAVVVGGARIVPSQLRLVTERRCSEVARREREILMDGRRRALTKWRQYLHTTRPSEEQMERWLDYDKKVLMDRALRYFRLQWRDVVTHAFLVLPSKGSQRAKELGGPWRYDRYDLRLFLLTRHGVRETLAQLTFVSASLRPQERHTFRFDALSSVRVQMRGRAGYVLEVTLTNGPPRAIQITDPTPMFATNPADDSQEELDKPRHDATEIDLDAAGFEHTRRVLEGIAADGKQWIS